MATQVQIRSPITSLVLAELRLSSADMRVAAGQIVAAFSGIEPTVPLLTSIEDPHDVALVWALHAGEGMEAIAAERNELDRFIAVRRPLKHYEPRITERSQSRPSYYRLAVTESGINDTDANARTANPSTPSDTSTASPLGLLWIGSPLGTHAGLLILLGGADDAYARRPDARVWPLPLSRHLGVRIYESQS